MKDRRFSARPRQWPALAACLAAAFLAVLPVTAPLAQTTGFEPMPRFTPDIGTLRTAPITDNARQDLFQLLDSDGNGVVDRAEWRDRKMLIFYVRDTDRDLQLTPDELAGIPITTFHAADLNGDALLSGFEFNQATFTNFEAADLDRDGVVLFEEFSRALDTLRRPLTPPGSASIPPSDGSSDPGIGGGPAPDTPHRP